MTSLPRAASEAAAWGDRPDLHAGVIMGDVTRILEAIEQRDTEAAQDLRLVDVVRARGWHSRGHFFAAAGEAVRRILVDRARKKRSQKRGGGLVRVELHETRLAAPAAADELIAVDEALERLAQADAQAAELVKLRCFAGLAIPEVAAVLNISPAQTARGPRTEKA
jgi:RNA polymerase sigma factor (TIGR02999 family)